MLTLWPLCACQAQYIEQPVPIVSTFDECVAAGNRILKSYPPQCVSADGQVFVGRADGVRTGGPLRLATPKSLDLPPGGQQVCVNKCGDGACQQIVCLGSGCPCAETPANCPVDCK